MPITIYKDIPRRLRPNFSLGLTIFDLKILDIYISKILSQFMLLGFGIRYKDRNFRVCTWW